MAMPVLVREYSSRDDSTTTPRHIRAKALPSISSFAFADILRVADGPELQSAIDGIAEICAKNRMSLADEHASHLPPLGVITDGSLRAQNFRPGMRRALTSVPEGSSGSSEGSRNSTKKRRALMNFQRQRLPGPPSASARTIRIGSMGRTISVGSTTALSTSVDFPDGLGETGMANDASTLGKRPAVPERRASEATASLQRVLARQVHTSGE